MHGQAQHHLHHTQQTIPTRRLDAVAYVLGIIGPLATIPQLYEVWIRQNADGVSLVTWSVFILLSFFWLHYAIRHKEKPLIVGQGMWVVMQILVVIGVLLYR